MEGVGGSGLRTSNTNEPDVHKDNDEDEITETDPDGRYYRYNEVVGKGRFKQIFKAFDTQIGIDVAWSKISADRNHLTDEELLAVVDEMRKGLDLEHPNIIKCFKCWEDTSNHSINLITELFTSGNLRQYRNLHKHLDLKAVKRMARQILKGLEYLHSMDPPVSHGDLRCDKIYVNGHSGEIKIGDLGLATLLPKRWEDSSPENPQMVHTLTSDIYSFGLCMLELLTLKQFDPQHVYDFGSVLHEVNDSEARTFVAKCLGPPDAAPSALQLLEDPFLSIKKPPPPEPKQEDQHEDMSLQLEKRKNEEADGDRDADRGTLSVGTLRGEDYNFEFTGKVKDGKMHFRLRMTQANDSGEQAPFIRTIDFVFDPEVDTADSLANEISGIFNLSSTDTEICAAALREWLAKEMPGTENSK